MPPAAVEPPSVSYQEATSALASRLAATRCVEVRHHPGCWRWIAGIDTRTRYLVADDRGRTLGWAAEEGDGLRPFAALQVGRLWRPFNVELFDEAHRLAFRAAHPARLMLARLDVDGGDGLALGAVQQRVSVPRKRFDVLDASGGTLLSAWFSALRRFEFVRCDPAPRVAASVQYRSARRSEVERRSITVAFEPPLSGTERMLVLAAALFVDLKYLAHGRRRASPK